jgi:hypothetical protein
MLRGTSRRTINDKIRNEKIKQDAKKLIIHVNNNTQQIAPSLIIARDKPQKEE